MMNMANKKEYSKPTVKAVRWNMKEALCSTVYEASPCIIVVGDEQSATHHEHIYNKGKGTVTWHEFGSNSSSIESKSWNGSVW